MIRLHSLESSQTRDLIGLVASLFNQTAVVKIRQNMYMVALGFKEISSTMSKWLLSQMLNNAPSLFGDQTVTDTIDKTLYSLDQNKQNKEYEIRGIFVLENTRQFRDSFLPQVKQLKGELSQYADQLLHDGTEEVFLDWVPFPDRFMAKIDLPVGVPRTDPHFPYLLVPLSVIGEGSSVKRVPYEPNKTHGRSNRGLKQNTQGFINATTPLLAIPTSKNFQLVDATQYVPIMLKKNQPVTVLIDMLPDESDRLSLDRYMLIRTSDNIEGFVHRKYYSDVPNKEMSPLWVVPVLPGK